MSSKPIIASSEFCGACKILKTQLDNSDVLYESKDFIKESEFFQKYKIKKLPALIIPETEETIIGTNKILKHFKINGN